MALQVPTRLADFTARELDFVANGQPVGHVLPCSSLFGDRDDLIGERQHFVQTIRPPQDEESGRERPTQGRGIPEAASKFHCLAAAHFLAVGAGPQPDRPSTMPAAHANRASTLARSRLSSGSPPSASSSNVDERLGALVIWLPNEPPAVPERGTSEHVGPARLASDVGRPEKLCCAAGRLAGPRLRVTESQQ